MSLDYIAPARELTESEVKMLLKLEYEDITHEWIKKYLVTTKSHEVVFNTYDTFTLPVNAFYNDKPIRTTIGKWIWNIKIVRKDLGKFIGYQNYPMNKKGLGKCRGAVTKLLLEDYIDGKRYADYLDDEDWCYSLVKYFGSSVTIDLVKPTKRANSKKQELLEKYKHQLVNGDFVTMNKIEKEVLDIAESEVKGTNDFEIYESGATGKLNNSFKNTTYFRGIRYNYFVTNCAS